MNNLFFSYHGRINRAKFWKIQVTLIVLLLAEIAAFAISVNDSTSADSAHEVTGFQMVALIILGLFALVLLYIGICNTIKRFHDRDKTGWWIVIQFVPVVGLAWVWFETGFLPGTVGPNSYGNDPLRQDQVSRHQINAYSNAN